MSYVEQTHEALTKRDFTIQQYEQEILRLRKQNEQLDKLVGELAESLKKAKPVKELNLKEDKDARDSTVERKVE